MSEDTFVDRLRLWAERYPDRPAITFLEDGEQPSGELTYAMLDRAARDIAYHVSQTIPPGERALLLYLPGIEFVTAFFGCLYAGVVAVPAYPPRNARHFPRLEAIVRDAGARAVLTQVGLEGRLSTWLKDRGDSVSLMCTDDVRSPAPAGWEPRASGLDALAFLQYTSGSTGAPKGVMVTHSNLMANEQMIQTAFLNRDGLIGVSWLPVYHDMGLIGNLMQPLFLGGHAVLMSPAAFLQKPRRWFAAISRYRAQWSGAPNFAFRLCTRAIRDKEGLDLSSLNVMFCGAEPIDASVIEEFAAAFGGHGLRREAIVCCYGMAETTLMASGTEPILGPLAETIDADALARHDARRTTAGAGGRVVVACGKTVAHQDLAIVDADRMTRLEEGRIGEIWVRGPNVAAGYWRQPELTRERFHAAILGEHGDGGRYLRTGDLGYLRAGELYVTGRIKDLIIIRGRNLYPHDIEMTVQNSHPAFRADAGAAFSVPFDGEERLVVVQEIERHQQVEAEAAAAAAVAAIADQYDVTPDAVTIVRQNSVLKTSSGKIQRRACTAAYLNGDFTVVLEWTATPAAEPEPNATSVQPLCSCEEIEELLVQQLARTLRIAPDRIDVTQPFNEMGLDSLQTVAMLGEMEARLGTTLSPTIFWNFPTIADLAAHLAPVEVAADAPGR